MKLLEQTLEPILYTYVANEGFVLYIGGDL